MNCQCRPSIVFTSGNSPCLMKRDQGRALWIGERADPRRGSYPSALRAKKLNDDTTSKGYRFAVSFCCFERYYSRLQHKTGWGRGASRGVIRRSEAPSLHHWKDRHRQDHVSGKSCGAGHSQRERRLFCGSSRARSGTVTCRHSQKTPQPRDLFERGRCRVPSRDEHFGDKA